ncbi:MULTISPECIES: hypothetical protein [Thalassobaculum]|uniref:Lipoprotein n=1 Tax=Thalassobaculum litoreum DSM 18839 TaxID=1123362 RepID=A0A8G2EW46_9PROT|nr:MULTISPECIES: hypothetical protein [Thalassobaculum]SDF62827.1 hypothetical protein SAMN05660686_01834 [Thalassobaculum litoreum DSM 18839]
MRLFIATACVLSLAACAGTSGRQEAAIGVQPNAKPAEGTGVRAPVPEPRPPVPRRSPDSGKSPGSGKNSAAAPSGQDQSGSGIPAASVTTRPPVDMDTLAGADRPRLQSVLGPADEVRDQPPGEVWIYREGGCSVELYLFPQISASQYAVLGHKFLPSSLGEEERTACLTKLASRTRAS